MGKTIFGYNGVIKVTNYKNINDNIISNKWNARYAKLSDDTKKKLDIFKENISDDIQLQIIKRSREYPKIGDIFKINPKDNIFLYGIVVNNHINNINGDELIMILIFKEGIDIKGCIKNGVSCDDLFLPPQIVGKEYWTRGFFYNIEHYNDTICIDNYGFYSVGKRKIYDEFGNELNEEPQLLGVFGVATIKGIAYKIYTELIILGLM